MARIRVIEDTPEIAWLAKFHLEAEHHTVITTTGEFERVLRDEAWNDIDVAVVDLMLPGINGKEILRWLSEHRPDIRRIAMTASLPSAEEVIGLAHETLIKPFSSSELARAVDGD